MQAAVRLAPHFKQQKHHTGRDTLTDKGIQPAVYPTLEGLLTHCVKGWLVWPRLDSLADDTHTSYVVTSSYSMAGNGAGNLLKQRMQAYISIHGGDYSYLETQWPRSVVRWTRASKSPLRDATLRPVRGSHRGA